MRRIVSTGEGAAEKLLYKTLHFGFTILLSYQHFRLAKQSQDIRMSINYGQLFLYAQYSLLGMT